MILRLPGRWMNFCFILVLSALNVGGCYYSSSCVIVTINVIFGRYVVMYNAVMMILLLVHLRSLVMFLNYCWWYRFYVCSVEIVTNYTGFSTLILLLCIELPLPLSRRISTGDGGTGYVPTPPHPQKNIGNIFFGQLLCKIRSFFVQKSWKMKIRESLIFRANIIKKIQVFW